MSMKTDLDHLPPRKRHELELVQEILFEEFADTRGSPTSERRKKGRILKIILFGSYARATFVEDQVGGYFSDYDLLIIVNHRELTEIAKYWYTAEDVLMRDKRIKTPVNFIVHTMGEVNDMLKQGQYFFTDIKRDGIMLYELTGITPKGHRRHVLAEPRPLSPKEAYDISAKYFADFPMSKSFLKTSISLAGDPQILIRRHAAFELHQATERAYLTLLLTLTHYVPHSHNIKFLRGLAEDRDRRLIEAWPRDEKRPRRLFELLKRAYIEARYSQHYRISTEELEWLGARVAHLQELAEEIGAERLAVLKQAVAGGGG